MGAIAVFIGGGFGSLLRWIVCSRINAHWGTLVVNIIGAFLIGLIYQYIAVHTHFEPKLKLFLMTGVLGGFTTFSIYLLDFVTLFNKGHISEALVYLALSIVIGVFCLICGIKCVNLFV